MEDEYWKRAMGSVPNCRISMGPYFTHQLLYDPRHLLFLFARYKFVARLIGNYPKASVLEMGCNEGFGTLQLAEVADRIVAVDFDSNAISWAKQHLEKNNLVFICNDFIGEKFGEFDVVVAIDVIEHIHPDREGEYLSTVYSNLNEDGFCVIGTPNITASQYTSKASKESHINLYSAERLRELFFKKFKNVFIFGMNDEVVHTGFYPMAHYLILLACNKR